MTNYKCEVCESVFNNPMVLSVPTGVVAPDGVREYRGVETCPYCYNQEVKEINLCRLCEEQEAKPDSDFCSECLKELEDCTKKYIDNCAKWYGTTKEIMLDAIYEIFDEL